MNIEENKKIFAERLKAIRTEKGYSQYKLADIMKCARTTISAYELGRNEPSYLDLIKLSKLFNVSAEWLMGNSDNPNPQDNKEQPPPSEMETVEWFKQGLVKYGVVKDGESLTDTQLKILLNNVEFLAEQLKNSNE